MIIFDNPFPTGEEVEEALSGNFCRCTSHYHVPRAVMAVAERGSDPDVGKV